MTKRREFTKSVKLQIVTRAMLKSGEIACEGCGLILGRKAWHVDHTIADGLQVDKSRKLTAADGKLLGVECCHKPKTKKDVKVISKAKRVEESYLAMRPAPRQKIHSAGFRKTAKPARTSSKQSLPFRSLYAPIADSEQENRR